jgi:hypothetical protein
MADRILFDLVEQQVAAVSEKGTTVPAGSKPIEVSAGSRPIEGVGTAVAAFVGLPVLVRHLEPLADGTWLALGLGFSTIPADLPGDVVLAVLVGVVAPASEARREAATRFSLCVLDSDGGLVAERMEVRVALTVASRVPDDRELTAQLPIVVRFPVESPGVYRAEMQFQDSTCRQTLVVSGRSG